MTQLGLYITGIRNACGKSIHDISQRTGIPQTDLEKLEHGKISPSTDQLLRLAQYFKASEREFLRINQASKVAAEAGMVSSGRLPDKASHTFFKSSPLSLRRIDNLKHNLSLLETRPLNVRFHVPAAGLRSFIESIVYCKGHNLGHPFESILPDGTAQLLILIGDCGREVVQGTSQDSRRFEKAWVMGINRKPVTYKLREETGAIYVRFRPAGLYAFTKISQDVLSGQVVDATDVFGTSLNELWETLASSGRPDEMIAHVESFFLNELDAVVAKPEAVGYMLDHIRLPLTQLVKKTGYSDKYLTKTFQKYVGVGPKVFQRMLRFHSSISNLNQFSHTVDWADVVFRHDYYDQAHFIKEFKYFSGLSPQNYLSLGSSCARYLYTSFLPGRLS